MSTTTATTCFPDLSHLLTEDKDSHLTLVLSALSLAAASNNDGAAFLKQRDVQKAYDCFKSSLDIINGAELSLLLNTASPQQKQQPWLTHCSSIAQQHYQQHHHHLPQHQQIPSFPIKELQQHALLTQRSDVLLQGGTANHSFFDASARPARSNTTSTSTPFQKSPFFVYKKAFLFAPNPHPSSITTRQLQCYKAQVVFNLAATLHQGGNCVDEISVFKALQLYDLALEYSMMGLSTTLREESLLLTMAALNNKAHIFYEFSEFNSLNMLLDTLFWTMTQLAPTTNSTNHSQHQQPSPEDVQGVLFNVYMLRDFTCARAA